MKQFSTTFHQLLKIAVPQVGAAGDKHACPVDDKLSSLAAEA
ncbi:hypothetical protein [Planctopirus hydrillae]|nr:hypothetical protein [Planctopirus hydrillae]